MLYLFSGSQVFDYLEPVKNSIGDRQAFADLNLIDDNRWQKRHSFSQKDYSSEYRPRLTSNDSVTREKLRSHYDVPPRRIKKVESFKRKASPYQHYQNVHSPNNKEKAETPYGRINDYQTRQYISESSMIDNRYDQYARSETFDSCDDGLSCTSQGSVFGEEPSAYLHSMANISSSEPVLCGNRLCHSEVPTCDVSEDQNISTSVPNSIDLDSSNVSEDMESLNKSELLLQREISLLDEILLVSILSCCLKSSVCPPVCLFSSHTFW